MMTAASRESKIEDRKSRDDDWQSPISEARTFMRARGAGLSLGSLKRESLIVLRKIGIKIIFPREDRFVVDLEIERERRLARHLHGLAVERRQRARQTQADRTGVALFGSRPNSVEEAQQIFESVLSCAWTSRPMTASQPSFTDVLLACRCERKFDFNSTARNLERIANQCTAYWDYSADQYRER